MQDRPFWPTLLQWLGFFKQYPVFICRETFQRGDREGMIPILSGFFCIRMHGTIIVSPREYYLVASFRSSPVDCCGSTVFFLSPRGRVELLSLLRCLVYDADFRGQDRWRHTSSDVMQSVR
jgi:hypothetical protein